MTDTLQHADYCDKIHYSGEYLCSDEKRFREKGLPITKEFPAGKENYCPRCYFGEPPDFFVQKVILRKDCPHN